LRRRPPSAPRRRATQQAKRLWKTMWFCCRARHAASAIRTPRARNSYRGGIRRESAATRVRGSSGRIVADAATAGGMTVAEEIAAGGDGLIVVAETAVDTTTATDTGATITAGTRHSGVRN